MSGGWIEWLEADVRRPFGFWTVTCLIACPVSLVLLKLAFYGQFVLVLVLMYLLFLSALATGIAALIQHGTTRSAPFVVLLGTMYLGYREFVKVTQILALFLLQVVLHIMKST